jgi:hypothetical protein
MQQAVRIQKATTYKEEGEEMVKARNIGEGRSHSLLPITTNPKEAKEGEGFMVYANCRLPT